jgi:hypothetical protein
MLHRFIFVALCIALPSLACTVSPAVASYSKTELIAKTATIVLAEHTGTLIEQKAVRFSFRTVEVLKGKKPRNFSLLLAPAPKSYVETDFSKHSDSGFWQGSYGRLPWLPGACEPTYAFELRGKYLLFLESIGNGAAAERVHAPGNKWYLHVRQALATG